MEDKISMVYRGDILTIRDDHPSFKLLKKAIVEKKSDKAIDKLLNPNYRGKISENITLSPTGVMRYKNTIIPTEVKSRIMNMEDKRGGLLFLENMMQNPSYRAVAELYKFLGSGGFKITSDGCFLAYKKIRKDYSDCHSGKVFNHVGTTVSIPRNQVDDDRSNTCSVGLHFCSFPYLKNFDGERLVLVKINPKDVVSIPNDYGNTKGRTCAYEVVEELDINLKKDILN